MKYWKIYIYERYIDYKEKRPEKRYKDALKRLSLHSNGYVRSYNHIATVVNSMCSSVNTRLLKNRNKFQFKVLLSALLADRERRTLFYRKMFFDINSLSRMPFMAELFSGIQIISSDYNYFAQ